MLARDSQEYQSKDSRPLDPRYVPYRSGTLWARICCIRCSQLSPYQSQSLVNLLRTLNPRPLYSLGFRVWGMFLNQEVLGSLGVCTSETCPLSLTVLSVDLTQAIIAFSSILTFRGLGFRVWGSELYIPYSYIAQ